LASKTTEGGGGAHIDSQNQSAAMTETIIENNSIKLEKIPRVTAGEDKFKMTCLPSDIVHIMTLPADIKLLLQKELYLIYQQRHPNCFGTKR